MAVALLPDPARPKGACHVRPSSLCVGAGSDRGDRDSRDHQRHALPQRHYRRARPAHGHHRHGRGCRWAGGWILASGLLARAGIYHQEPGHFRPWIGLAFAGYLTALLAASRIPTVAHILAAPGSLARLTLPHTLRVVGVLFLLVMALGDLPAIFALPAGLGDIAVGLAAPTVARRLARGDYQGAVRFHLLGLLDLVVAITIGYLAGLGPYQPFDIVPSTEPLSLLPLALVATVAVPTALALHLVALTRLHAADRTTSQKAAQLQPDAR
jgi:hypothetical protein